MNAGTPKRGVTAVSDVAIESAQNPKRPTISVIVPCRNHARELIDCLHGIQRQDVQTPFEVIVVDSVDDTAVVEAVETFPSVRLVRSCHPLRAGIARNLGADNARGDYLAFTDADCVPEPGWLAAAELALQRGLVLVGGPVTDVLPLHPIAAADNLLQFADWPSARADGPAEYFPGCNMAIVRDVFRELGGFPDTGLHGLEDSIFSEAIARRWPERVRFVQGMSVRHLGRTSVSQLWAHHAGFGYGRGLLKYKLKPFHERLGRSGLMVVPVALKRLMYILRRTLEWRPLMLVKIVLLSPLLVLGLLAWATGFRRGLRESTVASSENRFAGSEIRS